VAVEISFQPNGACRGEEAVRRDKSKAEFLFGTCFRSDIHRGFNLELYTLKSSNLLLLRLSLCLR